MSAQHTPGPWSINEWPQATTDIAIGVIGTPLIAKVPLRDVSINEQKANARLIAAAPDLLAVVEELEESADYWSEYDVPLGIVDRLRAAIAKATGCQA